MRRVAGADYVAGSGALNFASGGAANSVAVAVLDDTEDEVAETMALVFSNAACARITHAEANRTIASGDALFRAWLSRFGRRVAGQALDTLEARTVSPEEAGTGVIFARQGVGSSPRTYVRQWWHAGPERNADFRRVQPPDCAIGQETVGPIHWEGLKNSEGLVERWD